MRSTFTLLLLALLSAFTFTATAQRNENQVLQPIKSANGAYVLEVPRMEPVKLLPLFKERIRGYDAIGFRGFCESRNLLFIQSTPEAFRQVLKALEELGLVYFQKECSNLEEAMVTCNSPTEIEESLHTEFKSAPEHE